MNKEYYRVIISATSKEEADKITELLLKDKIIAGGFITSGESHHWWEGRIDREEYFNISCFTINENKNKIIKIVEENSEDEVPGVVFFKIDYGNENFLNWIEENIK
ncbi:MAG: divalent-cation tolerance protein CutA [Parcubacteria group bacterium]|nr:divalent-cation tolerance protein CutA [Parcubacteria group bacterium]